MPGKAIKQYNTHLTNKNDRYLILTKFYLKTLQIVYIKKKQLK